MGKATGFIEWERLLPSKRETSARLGDFNEFVHEHTESAAREQAGRCMDCGVPFCHQGCPLGNPIPDFNDFVYRERWQAAFEILSTTNNFPEFTGRLCPAPCEASCVLAINRDPVTIEQVERDIIERAFKEGWVKPELPTSRTGKNIAVVGSGPAGLAAAAQLNRAGHRVKVFERDAQLGGLLRYGIPDFKMEKWVIDRRLEIMREEGIELEVNAAVGSDSLSYADLRERYDAVVLCMGARVARDLQVPGRDLNGVVWAMDYLSHQNDCVSQGRDHSDRPELSAKGRRVIILGGGDTGSDCLGTALRQGAREVRQVELFPAPPEARAAGNPWPQWPIVFRTSSSQEEGGERAFGILTKELEGQDGRLTALHAVEVEVVQDNGRSVLRERASHQHRFDVDLLILAMGFTGAERTPLTEQLGVALDKRGNITVDESFACLGEDGKPVPGVFAAGDASRGASLIVWAISDGREAACAVDTYLTGRRSHLPTRGRHQPFGGR